VIRHYDDLAEAMYRDALAAARDLKKAVDRLIQAPSDATLNAARRPINKMRTEWPSTFIGLGRNCGSHPSRQLCFSSK
jgi:uncharacterized iron-regulated protein